MSPFEKAFEEVSRLTQQFTSGLQHYMSPGYSEAEARQDFIDDFFTALGWDVRHKQQTNPYQQEVKIEKSQKQQNETARKRADYAFFIGPNYKDEVFFAEAKKPSVLIENNPQHYFQTIKYGWNSGCPICVLTDFEEFAIIDCRSKPDMKYALNGKHKTYRYTDYTIKEKFAEIYWLFSREAVAQNSLTNYAAALPKAKGKLVQKQLFKGSYQAIDDSFLAYIDGIRENIAKAFKKANENLNSEQLTEATQRTVDRLVFIRFLEDKFIEAEEHVSEWQSWNHFITDCRKLDAKYNGVVFKKHFIDEPHFLGADEKLFLDICSDISNLNSPYDFNYIPIHILGSIYERFLGKVVVATDKRVKIEEKPEVRKAGGVYYTPKYIVDYIVKNTVGKIIETLPPKEIAQKRFADIACGSGSFLIGVYDYLLDYHKKYYTEKLQGKTDIDARSEDHGNVEYKDGQWVLTLKLKQEILLNNIYGVDIDAQAVEVTQLSLFLKMLEEENVSSTQAKQGALFSKVLPDLSKNIVCGNSLIGWDIMNGQLFENDELKKLNPMDYEAVFPTIMRGGGFDAVVGNPPYGANLDEGGKNYIKNNFKTFKYRYDSYIYFIEKALDIIKKGGWLGYITPELWLKLENCDALRIYISNNSSVSRIKICGENVFTQAIINTIVVLLNKTSLQTDIVFESDKETWVLLNVDWKSAKGLAIDYRLRKETRLIVDKIKFCSTPLSTYGDSIQGITPYDKYRGHSSDLIKKRGFHADQKFDESYGKWLDGKNVGRYDLGWSGEWLKYGEWLGAPREPKFFSGERILFREVPGKNKRIQSVIAVETLYHGHSITPFISHKNSNFDLKFFLGISNSKLISWYAGLILPNFGKEVFPKLNPQDIKAIPIFPIDQNIPEEKASYDKIINNVTQMLNAKKQLAAALTDSDKNFYQNQCNSLDRQIDKLVYELYGLTEEEIKIVEGV
jgi:adenine-specific DNA-methyltransferase